MFKKTKRRRGRRGRSCKQSFRRRNYDNNATTPQSTISTHGKTQEHLQHHFRYEDHLDSVDSETDYYDKHETSPDDMYSEYSMFSSSPQLPMVHSITSVKDQDSISNYHGSITEELPYLMTAFSCKILQTMLNITN